MIKKTAKNSHIKKILFILTTLLLVIGFTAFLVKDKGFKTLAYSSDLFVTRWQTNVPGATDPTKVTLRFLKVATDTYEVSWNCDDNYELFYTSLATHNYPTAGTYDVCVRSTRPLRFYAPDLADDEKAKLLEIKQWGTIPWSSFMSAFRDMKNMQLTATDTPDLSNVTDMSYAFNGATAFTGHSSMNNWNTSNIKNMSYMFYGATSFNQYIGNWNTGNVTSMLYMFNAATNFNNGEAPGASNNTMNWNTQNVQNVAYMFYGAKAFNQKIGSWDTNNVSSMIGMFFNASTFNQYIGNWQTGKVTSMTYMFSGAVAFNNGDAPGASSKPLNWDTSKVTFMNN